MGTTGEAIAVKTKQGQSVVVIPGSESARPLATLDPKAMETLIATGDLSKLTPAQRLQYYMVRCENAGLDPAAQPFAYIVLSGKMVLYALKGCSEQLTVIHGIRLEILEQKTEDGMRTVTVRVTTADGRVSEDIGSVSLAKLSGDALANALMKCVTKAKRRTILSVCGLGALDEGELETIPNARMVRVDSKTGDILDEGDRPYADPKPHASAVPPRTHIDRETGELTETGTPPEEEQRLRREEAEAFAALPDDPWARMEESAPAVREVFGVPITLGKSFDQIAHVKWPQFKPKRLDEMVVGAKDGQAERALRRALREAQDVYQAGGEPSEFLQHSLLALEEMLRLRGAKVAEETGMGMASDLIKPVKEKA